MSPTFEREKFRELVVYIAEKTADDPSFGDTKFNKTLYWIDAFGYSHLGQPVTGARYFKLPKGPAARPLIPVRQELAAEGAVEVQEPTSKYEPRLTRARRAPDLGLFTKEELALVDDIIRQISGFSAATISEVSHDLPGWNLVALGEDIPYSTALISTEPLRDETMARVRTAAARLGW
ncbi:MAG: Panacea domain-containing protein [Actinomycetota bacterium]|nr:Panacea domain-containing protein [Actinomycetota bacterium]